MTRYLIGIDEVGRGPLAGPVAVAALLAEPGFLENLGRIKDSKMQTERAREEWYAKIQQFQKEGTLNFSVSFVSEKIIDAIGIAPAIRKALSAALLNLECDPAECLVLLDGGLRAPADYVHQKTIVRGDASETVIALASIVAKVERDRKMIRFSEKFPEYGFEKHKGYGTKAHREAILKFGPSAVHRRSFLGNILD